MRFAVVIILVTVTGCTEINYYVIDQDAEVALDAGTDDATSDAGDTSKDAEPPLDAEPVDVEPCEEIYFRDSDGDGYGDPDDWIETCDGAPVGYVSNADDCYDDNAEAKPGQVKWFTVERGDGSFDYNCDEDVTLQWDRVLDWPTWCPNDVPSVTLPAWHLACKEPNYNNTLCLSDMSPPDCGETAMLRSTCGYGEVTPQGCR